MNRLRLLVRAAAVVCVLSLLAASPAVARRNPGTHVHVSPRAGLVDGQTVTVTVDGLPPNDTFLVHQCESLAPVDHDQGCDDVGQVTTDGSGHATTEVQVSAYLVHHIDPFDGSFPVYCRDDRCRLFLAKYEHGIYDVYATGPTLRFLGESTRVHASPSDGLDDGQIVSVTGRAVGAAGRTVLVYEEACFSTVEGRLCEGDDTPTQTLTVAGNGRFATAYAVQSEVDGMRCGSGADCQITATVLDEGGSPDYTFNSPRFNDANVQISFGG